MDVVYFLLFSGIPDPASSPPPPIDHDDSKGGTGSNLTIPNNENLKTTSTTSTVSPAEQQVGRSEEEEPVKEVGIGLGTTVGVVVIAFAIFTVITVYCMRKHQARSHIHDHFRAAPHKLVLGPVPLRRSKRTKTLPDSPLKKEPLCKLTQKECAEKEDRIQMTENTGPSCVSVTDASPPNEDVDKPVNESNSRAKQGLRVMFTKQNLLDVTDDSSSPPPPLPPRSFEDDIFCECKDKYYKY